MRRNHEIKVRLNDDEYNDLTNKLNKSSMSRERFIRTCIKKAKFYEPPNIDYYKLINEFNAIGNNLNQITKMGHIEGLKMINVDECIALLNKTIINLNESVRG